MGLAGLHLAYVCLFYTVSFRFGAWSPLEVPFTNGVVTPLPFVEPLFYGALPAIQEEIFYRGIVLYLLWRALRRFWLAALLSSALWAFLHGGYPTEPFYMRGLELLPVGLVFCWFALRYGILASISAHYTYNALLTAVVYLQMDAPYLRFSALMSALGMTLLLLPALWVVLRYRQLPSLEAVEIPAGTTAPAPIVREPLVAPYRPLRPADWIALGVVLSLALISPFFYQPDQPDKRRQFQVNRQEAIQIARRYLLSKGADLRGYRAIATFETGTEDELAHQYAKEQGQEKQYQQVEETMREPSFWQIWFFRPLTRIHWYVWVAPNGQVIDFKRVLPEESPEILTRLPSRMNRAQAEKVAHNISGIVLIGTLSHQPDQPDRRRQLQVNQQEAIQIARRYLLSKGADLRGYRAIATFETGTEDELAHQYAKEQGQEKQYQQVEETMREPSFWQIWFFRPLTRIHWYVWVAPNGQVIDFKRVLPEESPEILTRLPSRMNRAQAEKVATQYLEQELGIDLDEWKLVETDQERHPNRTDYRFTYEHRRYRLGDAAYRMQVEVQGGLAHNVSLWWDLPESWHYKRKRFQSFWSLLGLGWVILWLLIMVAWVLVVEWREGTFSSFSRRLWWLSFVAGALLIGLAFYSDLETLIWSDYELSMQPRVHLILSLTGLGVGVLVLAGLLALGYAGFEPHYWRLRLGHLVPLSLWLCPSRWATAPADSPLRHPRAWQEGTLIALLIAIVAAFVRYRTDVEMPSVEAQHLWLETVSVAGLGTLFIGMFLLMAVGIYRRYIRSVWRLGVLILLLAPVVLIGADSWQVVKERLQGYFLGTAVGLLISFWLSRRLLQGHLVAWGLTLYLLLLAAIATPLLAVADETIRWQGWLALSFALPPLLVCFMAYRYVQRLQAAQAAVATPTLDAEHAVVQITTPPETPVGEEERQV
jgi:membrane protease YdiL (CAAX protease family)/stage V sporulation protein SpoVS